MTNERIRSRPDVTILAASKVMPAANQRMARVVLYRNPMKASRVEYVVHTETLEPAEAGHYRHLCFDDGNYVADLSTALDRFNERCDRL